MRKRLGKLTQGTGFLEDFLVHFHRHWSRIGHQRPLGSAEMTVQAEYIRSLYGVISL